ncbi:hypothetical protein AB4501_31900, partial [Vibrio sp. 10N.222.55.E8]
AAESTDLLDDFLDNEWSGDELSSDGDDDQQLEPLDPFDDLLTRGIEDELESEEQTFDKVLDAAFDFDKANDDLIKDSGVEPKPVSTQAADLAPSEAE